MIIDPIGHNRSEADIEQEPICEELLNDMHGPSETKVLWNAAVGLLKQIPLKHVCDVLLYSFLVGVRPIHPIIHVPTFRRDYDEFWHWCRHSDSVTPSQRLIDDPSFTLLLFAVLYSGAVVAPSSLWRGAQALKGLDRETVIEQLRATYMNGLRDFQSRQRPTLNTLVASLLGRVYAKPDEEAFDDLAFVGTMVRIAQSMGLHRDCAPSGADPVTQEVKRRIWFHIVSLDTQYAFQYGSQTFCGIEGSQWDVAMISEASDEALAADPPHHLFGQRPTLGAGGSSPVMLFAIGRYEAARFMHALSNRVHSCHRLVQADLDHFLSAYKELHGKISALVNRMPAQGIPEKGFVPSRLANASMLTHEALYTENSEEPGVFSSWARITLTMLSTGTLISLQKIFLNHPGLSQEPPEKLWVRYVHTSMIVQHNSRLLSIPAPDSSLHKPLYHVT